MSVVNLVTLLANAASALDHVAWEVGDVEAPVLAAVLVQVMGTGAVAIVHMGEVLLGGAAYHLVVVAATAGRLHIVILVVIHLMLMEIKAGPELKQIWNDIFGKRICNTVVLIGSVSKRDLCYICSFHDNEVVRTCGFASLQLCKVFQPPKGVPWTPFCVGLLSSAYETGRFISYFILLSTIYLLYFYVNLVTMVSLSF